MVAVIVIIAIGGTIAVGAVKGWFSDEADTLAVAEEVTGIASVERNGVSFELEKDAVLKDGDKIISNEKAEVLIKSGGNTYKMAENSEAVLGQSVTVHILWNCRQERFSPFWKREKTSAA